jgi:hypothetical protein
MGSVDAGNVTFDEAASAIGRSFRHSCHDLMHDIEWLLAGE